MQTTYTFWALSSSLLRIAWKRASYALKTNVIRVNKLCQTREKLEKLEKTIVFIYSLSMHGTFIVYIVYFPKTKEANVN